MSEAGFHSGAEVDGFVLGERLGQPMRATFWRVTRPGLELPAVMKVPRLADADSAMAAVGFEVEQRVLAKLSGPHAPRLVAAGDFSGQPYLVMEYVAGPSLHDRLPSVLGSVDEVSEVGARIADALADLHRQRVVHLDVQPHNILFRRSGEAALINYGLANHLDLPDLIGEAFRLPLGSGTYISPEQVLQVRTDPRSDLFALGVILYYLIAHTRPFGRPTSIQGLRRRLYHDPDPPRAINRACPPWLQEVVLACLEIDPSRRYQSAAEVAAALRHPEQVALTDRARRGRRAGPFAALWRSLRSRIAALRPPTGPVAAPVRRGRAVLVAVDLDPGAEPVAKALLVAVRRLLTVDRTARLMCVAVRTVAPHGSGQPPGEHESSLNARRLVELKHWARTLWLPAERVTFQVLESTDPAQAIIDYIATTGVERVFIGSRGHSSVRRFLGSVSSRVVAEAPCTVTVVRAYGIDREGVSAAPDSPGVEREEGR